MMSPKQQHMFRSRSGSPHRLRTLVFPSLMVIDEIGYLLISRTRAMLFFQLLSRRYEQASTILTNNKGFEEWGEVFGDDVMAAALIDRLVHHCHIVNIRGKSYRLRQHAELARRLHVPPRRERRQEAGTTLYGSPSECPIFARWRTSHIQASLT